jgi:hypothetical protein
VPAAGPEDTACCGWTRFWFTPVAPTGLHAVRLLTGLLLLAWLLPLAGHVNEFFGINGWFDREAYAQAKQLIGQSMRPLGWSVAYFAGDNPAALSAVFWLSVAAVALFTLGVATRITAVLAWAVAVSFTINPAIEYDADAFLVTFTLYLMLGYLFLGQRESGQSWARRLLGRADTFLLGRRPSEARPSIAANVALRLLQLHFAIIVVTSALHKLQFGDWWSGYALWYVLYPAGETAVREAREHVVDRDSYLFILSLSAYVMLAWQLAFPLFAWRHRPARPDYAADGWLLRAGRALVSLRAVLIGGALVGWAGLMLIWRLPLVGPALFIGCLSYLTPLEWESVVAVLQRVPGLRWLVLRTPEPAPEAGEPALAAEEAGTLVATGGRS